MARPDVFVCDEVRAVLRLHADLLSEAWLGRPIREQLDAQAGRLVEAHGAGDPTVATHVTCWHPRLVGRSADEILRHAFTIEDARETIAREYGFGGWADVVDRGADPPHATFEAAVDALLAGELDGLRALLDRDASLVRRRSDYGHRATLLHYVGSNGVETRRQVVPSNLAGVAGALLEAGADVNAEAGMYGGGSTTIGLLITSAHPHDAGVADDVVRVLVEAGAETDDG